MALSIVFLGEKVGIRRWSAAAVGLIGVLIVIRPGSGTFQAAALLPLLSAASWALGAIITRKTGSDHALTTMIYTSIIGAISLSASVPFEWVIQAGTWPCSASRPEWLSRSANGS